MKFTAILFFANLMMVFVSTTNAQMAESVWQISPSHMQTRWSKDVTPKNAMQEYPRPQLRRKNWYNLNGLWDYAVTKKELSAPLIYSGKILVPYPIESILSGVKRTLTPNDCIWYKRNFPGFASLKNKRLLLHFGAVDWEAEVFLNGRKIGGHQGGYQHFSFDVTDYIRSDSNEILVKVTDPTDEGYQPRGKQTLNPRNIYYTASSGMWQTVWLEEVPDVYISKIRITPDIDQKQVSIQLNVMGNAKDYKIEILAGKEKYIFSNDIESPNHNLKVSVSNPILWTPDDPFLYDLTLRIIKNNKTVDEVKSYFGMRKVEIKKDEKGYNRIFLNNKPVFNFGVLDQGFWPDGLYTAPTDEALAFDIKVIKAMGFNTIRKHIKIEPERWYYHADKLGLMVWQDMVQPSFNLTEAAKTTFEKEALETVNQLYNHPCITTWVVFNEGWGVFDQQRLTQRFKDFDTTRLVNGHSGELLYVNERLRQPSKDPWVGSDMADVHSYPDPMLPVHQSDKVSVLGEYGGIRASVGDHEWNDLAGWGYSESGPEKFILKYDSIIQKIQNLETQGLSGAIYTQPFDVEGEENGLFTYDRSVIKIPLGKLRQINSKIIRPIRDYGPPERFYIAENMDTTPIELQFRNLKALFDNGRRDSSFLRKITLMAFRLNKEDIIKQLTEAYLANVNNVFCKENLSLVQYITKTPDDYGFSLFQTKSSRVDSVLGSNIAEQFIMDIIYRNDIAPLLKDRQVPNWDAIEKSTVTKYGSLGAEKVWGLRMLHYWKTKDWMQFGKYYALYFSKAYTRSDFHINNATWDIFENINDPIILEIAINVSKYNIDTKVSDDPSSIDTYANLLYKTGKVSEAIKWEEKALGLEPKNKDLQANLEKMKSGVKTWSNN